jgi:hypothetical protein
VARASYDEIDSIYNDRLAMENKILEVFQDTTFPLSQEEINSFFNLVEWQDDVLGHDDLENDE